MQLGNYSIIVSYLDVTMRVSTEEEKSAAENVKRGRGALQLSALPRFSFTFSLLLFHCFALALLFFQQQNRNLGSQ